MAKRMWWLLTYPLWAVAVILFCIAFPFLVAASWCDEAAERPDPERRLAVVNP
jgi:hypothetical protein